MIRVTFYFSTGREQSAHDCDTIEDAYKRCQRMGMEAIAYPVGTTSGVYQWSPGAANTLEAFRAKMVKIQESHK
jgi:hypothetical protein